MHSHVRGTHFHGTSLLLTTMFTGKKFSTQEICDFIIFSVVDILTIIKYKC